MPHAQQLRVVVYSGDVDTPPQAILDVLERHVELRALFDNRWLHLFALDGQGRMALRYAGDLRWEEAAIDAEAAGHRAARRTPTCLSTSQDLWGGEGGGHPQ